eukprot:6865016-Prymnesium_polylepis.1
MRRPFARSEHHEDPARAMCMCIYAMPCVVAARERLRGETSALTAPPRRRWLCARRDRKGLRRDVFGLLVPRQGPATRLVQLHAQRPGGHHDRPGACLRSGARGLLQGAHRRSAADHVLHALPCECMRSARLLA